MDTKQRSRAYCLLLQKDVSDLQVNYTMMKGTENNPGILVCKAVENYGITTVVVGRRGLGRFERFVSGSSSSYIVEHANCNVIVVKVSVVFLVTFTSPKPFRTRLARKLSTPHVLLQFKQKRKNASCARSTTGRQLSSTRINKK